MDGADFWRRLALVVARGVVGARRPGLNDEALDLLVGQGVDDPDPSAARRVKAAAAVSRYRQQTRDGLLSQAANEVRVCVVGKL